MLPLVINARAHFYMGTLSTEDRQALASRQVAFPALRKEPLEKATQVRKAVAAEVGPRASSPA